MVGQMRTEVDREELARRLREAREACGLTQEDVARRLGVSRPAVTQIELGNRAVSGLELDRLAHLYGRDLRDFLAAEFRPEEALLALFRAGAEAGERGAVAEALRECIAVARDLTSLEELLGLDRLPGGVPSYAGRPPAGKWQAIQQGEQAAAEERRRLGLGSRRLGDAAGLLEEQGIRTLLIDLPLDVSGLTWSEPLRNPFVGVNRLHPVARRRFSWMHEYGHVLFDRERQATVSRAADRESLIEVRANSFAAAFLLPADGVREYLAGLGKGQGARERMEVFDGEEVQIVERRAEPGARALQLYEVAVLAHHLGVSRKAALHRLHSLRLVSGDERTRLLAEEEAGRGRALADLLQLPEPDASADRDEFRWRFFDLALEAYRREKISLSRLRELAARVGFPGAQLDSLLAAAGLDDEAGPDPLPAT
jgi:Zn-dependent peptidase ImmA (M78 family)/transcriptional regulator with XRE-family HTH domain